MKTISMAKDGRSVFRSVRWGLFLITVTVTTEFLVRCLLTKALTTSMKEVGVPVLPEKGHTDVTFLFC